MKRFRTNLRELAIESTAKDFETHCDLLDAYETVYDSDGNHQQDELDDILYRITKKEFVEKGRENRLMFTFINLYRCKTERDVRSALQTTKGEEVQLETIKRYQREITKSVKTEILDSEDIKKQILDKLVKKNANRK